MRDILQRCLLPAPGHSPRIVDCRNANRRQRDGSRGTVHCNVLLEDTTTGERQEQAITGLMYGAERTRRVWEVVQQAQTARGETLTAGWLMPFAYVPELGMLLQVFPHDHRLPGLAALLTNPPSQLVTPLLQSEAFGPGAWRMRQWEARTIQYRPDMRAIVQVDLTAHDESGREATRRFFAKVYRDAGQCEAASAAQRQLHDATRSGTQSLAIARPVHLASEFRTLVTAALPGASLSKVVRRREATEKAARAAARAVAEFQQLEPGVTAPARPAAEEMVQLREAAAQLAAVRPDLAEAVAEMVTAIATRLADAPVTLIHGDLKPDHLLIDGERVGLIDFDLLARADPMIDIAHLVAFLAVPQERARRRDDGARLAAPAFLDEYFRHMPAVWRNRMGVYHAITSVHKAVGLSRRGGDRGDRIDDVLAEGQAILAGRGDGAAPPSFKRRLTRTASN